MPDPVVLLSIACAVLAGLGIAAGAALRGWTGWLEIKRLELNRQGALPRSGAGSAPGVELAHLKERVRRLEAIAAGVDF